jgi:hypothetical protein
MGKWDKFRKDNKESVEETTPFPTMNLRCVVSQNGQTIEQEIQYRNSKGMVVNSEWVAIPIIYQQE